MTRLTTVTPADRKRLAPVLGNLRTALIPWLRTVPPIADLQKAVTLEVERAAGQYDPCLALRRGVLDRLRIAIQRAEWREVELEIERTMKRKKP